jgi:hypothetical protein
VDYYSALLRDAHEMRYQCPSEGRATRILQEMKQDNAELMLLIEPILGVRII